MKKLEKKFQNLSENVHLSEAEKKSMRAYLSEYLSLKPVRAESLPQPSPSAASSGGRFGYFNYFHAKSMPLFVAIALLFAGSAGASVAARHALPGDLLYPIKVSINEKVTGALAISENAKASYETGLADTRLTEAEALAQKNSLSTSTASSLEAGFTAHADSARVHIAALQNIDSAKGDAQLSSLADVLSAHSNILKRGAGDEKKKNLVAAIRSEAAVASDLAGVDESATIAAMAAPMRAAKTAPAAKPAMSVKNDRTGIRALLQSVAATSTENSSATSSESSLLNEKKSGAGVGDSPLDMNARSGETVSARNSEEANAPAFKAVIKAQ